MLRFFAFAIIIFFIQLFFTLPAWAVDCCPDNSYLYDGQYNICYKPQVKGGQLVKPIEVNGNCQPGDSCNNNTCIHNTTTNICTVYIPDQEQENLDPTQPFTIVAVNPPLNLLPTSESKVHVLMTLPPGTTVMGSPASKPDLGVLTINQSENTGSLKLNGLSGVSPGETRKIGLYYFPLGEGSGATTRPMVDCPEIPITIEKASNQSTLPQSGGSGTLVITAAPLVVEQGKNIIVSGIFTPKLGSAGPYQVNISGDFSLTTTQTDENTGAFSVSAGPFNKLGTSQITATLPSSDDGSFSSNSITISVTGAGGKIECKENDKNCSSSAGQYCRIDSGQRVNADAALDPNLLKPELVGIFTAIGCIPTQPTVLIQNLLKVATGAGGGVALLLMVYGSFQMITSGGNPDNLKKGQEQFTSAVIGLLFIIFSVLLLQVIGFNILGIPGFGK